MQCCRINFEVQRVVTVMILPSKEEAPEDKEMLRHGDSTPQGLHRHRLRLDRSHSVAIE